MTIEELPVGTRIHYTGDRCNVGGFGTITKHHLNARFGNQVEIAMDGEDAERITVTPSAFSERYLGHCGSRFVTLAAYREWQAEKMLAYRKVDAMRYTR
jgi:hypothetical protein